MRLSVTLRVFFFFFGPSVQKILTYTTGPGSVCSFRQTKQTQTRVKTDRDRFLAISSRYLFFHHSYNSLTSTQSTNSCSLNGSICDHIFTWKNVGGSVILCFAVAVHVSSCNSSVPVLPHAVPPVRDTTVIRNRYLMDRVKKCASCERAGATRRKRNNNCSSLAGLQRGWVGVVRLRFMSVPKYARVIHTLPSGTPANAAQMAVQ